MHLLIVCSTLFECLDFKEFYSSEIQHFYEKNIQLDFLISGVGTVPVTYNLTRHLLSSEVRYDGMIQVGIAGSFREKYKVGDMVSVDSEVFGDSGAEQHDGTSLDLFELNLWEKNTAPFDNKVLFKPDIFPVDIDAGLPQVQGLTVNLGSGDERTINHRKKKFAADIETMEGAPFFYSGILEKIPFRQIRCISNPITPRDTSQWQIKKAIDTLNEYMIRSFS